MTSEEIKQHIKDLIITAFEGGSNYWYCIEDHNAKDLDAKDIYDLLFMPKGYIHISAPEYTEMGIRTLNLESLICGWHLMISKHTNFYKQVLNDSYDAETADVYLQLCLFGEIIFG